MTLIALASAQYQKSSKDAAIVSEARYLAVDGKFGSAYKQEDGVEFKEESDVDGNRRGQYSYVDPNGVRRTVHYTAGKDGFRATGDHIPVPVQPPAVPAVPSVPAPAPVDHYQHQEDDYDDSKNYQYNDYQYSAPNPPPQPVVQPKYNPVPPAPQPHFNPPQFSLPKQPQYNPVQFQYQAPVHSSTPLASFFNSISTEQPLHRFQHPGKLNVNRSPDGFSYTFNTI